MPKKKIIILLYVLGLFPFFINAQELSINELLDSGRANVIINPEKSADYFSEAFKLVHQQVSEGKIDNMTFSFDTKSDSLETILKKKIEKHATSSIEVINSCIKLAKLYHISRPDLALEYYLQANELAVEMLNSDKKVESYILLAEFYRATRKLSLANTSINKAKTDINHDDINDTLKAQWLHRKAAILNETDKIDSSIYYSKKSLTISKKLNLKEYQAISLNELGSSFEKQEQFNSAKDYFLKTRSIVSELNLPESVVLVNLNLGRIEKKQGNYDLSEKYLYLAIEQAADNKYDFLLKRSVHSLYTTLLKKGDYKNAMSYLRIRTNLKSLENQEETRLALHEIQSKYEVGQKEKELIKKEFEIEKAESNQIYLTKQKNYLFIGITVLSIVLIILFVVIKKLTFTKKELESKNTTIHTALDQNKTLLKEVHHRVKNNLQFVISLLSLQQDHIKDKNALDALKNSQRRIKSMSLIHQKLYGEDSFQEVNTAQYVSELVNYLKRSLTEKPSKIEIKLGVDSIEIPIETAIPMGLIINELTNNAFKHAFTQKESGILKIICKRINQNNFLLEVRDNGSGIDDFNENAIANYDSLGFQLIYDMVKQLNGSISYQYDNGTCFHIIIPLKKHGK